MILNIRLLDLLRLLLGLIIIDPQQLNYDYMKSSLAVLAISMMKTGWTMLIASKLLLSMRMVSLRIIRLALISKLLWSVLILPTPQL